MTSMINVTVEILGKLYPVRCLESEVSSLQEAAKFLNEQMTEIRDSGKVINLERIAIIAALNTTNQFLQLLQQKNNHLTKINHRINKIQEKIEAAMNKSSQTELVYISE